jgi:tetratricopeptide (TPR) repeat protein
MWLQPAAHERFETGTGFAHAGLIGRDKANPSRVSDVRVKGEIVDFMDAEGRRQFTGSNSASYWTTRGASGSPVFLESGQQLAGIMSLSETGANEGETHLHETFVVPATIIHKYLAARLPADQQAAKRGINPDVLKPILAKLGEQNVPDGEIAERLDASIEAILAQAKKPVSGIALRPSGIATGEVIGTPIVGTNIRPSNDGTDIDAAIAESRAKLGALDTAGALDVLRAKITEEEQERARRLVPLLKEQATVERLAFDYDAAKKTLAEVTRLARDDVEAFINLGDLYVTTGPLEEVAKAFRNAEAAARRQGDDRNLSVAYERIGVQMAQGDAEGALKSYSESRAIIKRLAKSGSGNALCQYDLSISHNKTGDAQMAQGDLKAAMTSYKNGLSCANKFMSIVSRLLSDLRRIGTEGAPTAQLELEVANLRALISAMRNYQCNASETTNKFGDWLKAVGDLEGAVNAYSDSLDTRERLAKLDPRNMGWQRDLAASYSKLADAHRQSGDKAKARAFLRQRQEIMARLTKLSPDNAVWKQDLAWFERQIKELGP